MRADSKRTEELLSEIKQISSQYNAEVDRARKTWPRSIKIRIIELRRLGHDWRKISSMTGISYYTVLNWSHRYPQETAADFKAVTVTMPNGPIEACERQPKPNSGQLLTVTVADRFKIEGLRFGEAIALLRKLKI